MPARKKFDKLRLKPEYTDFKTDAETEKSIQKRDADKPDATHKYLFRPARREHKKNKVYAVGFIHVYIPFLAVFVLSLINGFLMSSGAYNGLDDIVFLTLRCIISSVIFVVPAVAYCRIIKKSLHKELSVHRFSPSYLPFIAISLLLLILVTSTERISIAYFFPTNETEQIIYLSNESNKLGVILAYAVFPAICEGLFLCGLLRNGISEKAGGLSGIAVTALAFALIHMDFRYFAVYLSIGFILAVCAHVTGSVIPCIIVYALNNLFSLVFSARLSFIASERTGNEFLLVILVLFILLFLMLYLKSLETLCIKKACLEDIKNDVSDGDSDISDSTRMYYSEPYTLFSSSGFTLHKLLRVLFSPAIIAAAILFMFAVI